MEEFQRSARRSGARKGVGFGFAVLLAVAIVMAILPQAVSAAPITVALRPTANADIVEWSKNGGGGKNYERVDDTTSDGDATYVYESGLYQSDTYEMQDLPISGTVSSLSLKAVARLASGACVTVCLGLALHWPSGGLYYGYDGWFPLGSSYTMVTVTYPTKPGTSDPWTVAEVNAMRQGITRSDGGGTVRVTQVWMEVVITPTTSTVLLRPNANGATIDWRKNGGGGRNFDRVDEVTSDGDATYVYTTNGAYDYYQVTDLGFAGTIDFVRIHAVARVSAGTCTAGPPLDPYCMQLGVNDGGPTTWFGPALRFGSSYTEVTSTWTTHPGKGTPWSVADVNALQVVLLKADYDATVRVTQVWVEVQITPTG